MPREMNEFADSVYRMVEGRFLKASSVGFVASDWEMTEDEERSKMGGVDFKKQQLLEWSVVPVPSDANALLDAKSMGIDVAPINQWVERAIDEKIWVPMVGQEELQKAWFDTVENEAVSVAVPEALEEEEDKVVDKFIEENAELMDDLSDLENVEKIEKDLNDFFTGKENSEEENKIECKDTKELEDHTDSMLTEALILKRLSDLELRISNMEESKKLEEIELEAEDFEVEVEVLEEEKALEDSEDEDEDFIEFDDDITLKDIAEAVREELINKD
jgi:hypothetical protein